MGSLCLFLAEDKHPLNLGATLKYSYANGGGRALVINLAHGQFDFFLYKHPKLLK